MNDIKCFIYFKRKVDYDQQFVIHFMVVHLNAINTVENNVHLKGIVEKVLVFVDGESYFEQQNKNEYNNLYLCIDSKKNCMIL